MLTFTPAGSSNAPAASAEARWLGQAKRGLTRRRSFRPKLAITRAAAPTFSGSWGASRITAGAVTRGGSSPRPRERERERERGEGGSWRKSATAPPQPCPSSPHGGEGHARGNLPSP